MRILSLKDINTNTKKKRIMTTKILGRYIIADPSICHGEPTFRGTRILVKDVLEQIESGMACEAIIEEWRGTLTKEAFAVLFY